MGAGNTDVNSNLVQKLWSKELYRNVIERLFFMNHNMMGEGDNNIIQTKTDLKKSKGDELTFGITGKLSGDGVDGDDELEGNEEKITGYDESVKIGQRRNAVRIKGKFTEQKAAYNMRTDGKNKLAIWSQEFQEMQIMLKLAGVTNTSLTNVAGTVVGTLCSWVNTPAYIPDAHTAAGVGTRYVGAAAAASLASTDLITPALISRCKAKAVQTNDPKMIPLDVDGGKKFVLLIHPRQAYDLKRNAEFTQANRDAMPRGSKNPIFTGALGEWDDVIIHEHPYVPFLDISVAGNSFRGTGTGTDFSADTYRAIFCGQQAASFAYGQYDKAWVEKMFDYDNKLGMATGMMIGVQKNIFNSVEYGVIALDTAATAV